VTVVVVVAVAALALVASTGHLGQLATLRVRAVRLLVAAAGLQVGTAILVPGWELLREATTTVSMLLVALFLAGNHRLPGMPLVAAGLLLNGLVIVANGAMPVSAAAARHAGLETSSLRLGEDPLRERLDDSTRLAWLADRVPLATPGRPQVVSAGDILVAAGVGLLLIAGSVPREPRRRSGQEPRPRPRSTTLAMESTTRGSYS